MPLLQAASAAGGGGMLGYEDWMVVPRSLFSIVGGLSRRQPLLDEICGMELDFLHAFLVEIVNFFRPQVDPSPERRSFQPGQGFLDIFHPLIVSSSRSLDEFVFRSSSSGRGAN